MLNSSKDHGNCSVKPKQNIRFLILALCCMANVKNNYCVEHQYFI